MPRGSPSSLRRDKPTAPTAPIMHTVQIQPPGFFSNMMQGFGLGAGQAIAQNIFRSDPKVTHVIEHVYESKEYIQCMKDNNYEDCKYLI